MSWKLTRKQERAQMKHSIKKQNKKIQSNQMLEKKKTFRKSSASQHASVPVDRRCLLKPKSQHFYKF